MNDLLGPGFSNGKGDVELGLAGASEVQDQSMQRLFSAVEAVKADMAEIKRKQTEIEAMHDKSKALVKSKEVQALRQEMQESINSVNALAHKVKSKVEGLDKENEAARKVKGQGPGSANERTRTSITAGLKKKLKDQMGEFSNLRNRIQDEYRDVVERRVYAATGQHMAEEEIDKMIVSGEAENVFKQVMVTDQQGRGRVMDTLAEIQERHSAMQALEQSLLELHQIFLDMAVLVETQGEQIDSIDKQVDRAVDYVEGGAVVLVEAKDLQNKSRKWLCYGLILFTIIAIIVILAVVLTIKPWTFAKN